MSQPLLSDPLWAVIEPLIRSEPEKPKRGRPHVGDRAAVTGIHLAFTTLAAALIAWRFRRKMVLSGVPRGRLITTCTVCNQRGVYCLSRLRRRFGKHADVYDIYIRLTQTCRCQHEVGARRPKQYGRACRAHIDTDEAGR